MDGRDKPGHDGGGDVREMDALLPVVAHALLLACGATSVACSPVRRPRDRHGRACPGHPRRSERLALHVRLCAVPNAGEGAEHEGVRTNASRSLGDGRDKPGHDGAGSVFGIDALRRWLPTCEGCRSVAAWMAGTSPAMTARGLFMGLTTCLAGSALQTEFLRRRPEIVMAGLVPAIHAVRSNCRRMFASARSSQRLGGRGARRRGWPGQARP